MQRLAQKIAMVTGGGRGIGQSICRQFALNGATVIFTYNRHRDQAAATLAELRQISPASSMVKLELQSPASIKRCMVNVCQKYGNIDILVNNAAKLQQKPFDAITVADWDEIMNINLRGTFLLSQLIFNEMKKRRTGKIINLTSIGGQVGGPLAVHYAVSKAAVIGLTRSLANVCAPYNIQVNAISPGLVGTDMVKEELRSAAGQKKLASIPLQRIAEPDEIAAVATFLASEEANYITGQTINVNGGMYLG